MECNNKNISLFKSNFGKKKSCQATILILIKEILKKFLYYIYYPFLFSHTDCTETDTLMASKGVRFRGFQLYTKNPLVSTRGPEN